MKMIRITFQLFWMVDCPEVFLWFFSQMWRTAAVSKPVCCDFGSLLWRRWYSPPNS